MDLTSGSCTSSLRIIKTGLSGAAHVADEDGHSLFIWHHGALCSLLPLHADTPGPLSPTIAMRTRHLQCLWLRPRRHPKPQHLPQGPDVVGQPRRHGRCPRLPPLG